MRSIVYTYVNKKPVFHELDRFYYVKDIGQLELLIDNLLNIDAVTSPCEEDLRFPALLELESGFAPTLKLVNIKAMEKELKKFKKLLKKVAK